MNALLARLLDLLYPPKCVFCGRLLQADEAGWCGECQKSLPWMEEGVPEKPCPPATRCVAPLWYQGEARESFHRYKFRGRDLYAPAYGALMTQCVRDRLGLGFDLVVWVPLSRKRRRQRGYDQAELLARVLARELDKPALPALRKVRDTVEQSSLRAAGRARNVSGVYEAVEAEAIAGKRVLLVDDIVTTGSTLSACAQALLDAGAGEVWAAVFARAKG